MVCVWVHLRELQNSDLGIGCYTPLHLRKGNSCRALYVIIDVATSLWWFDDWHDGNENLIGLNYCTHLIFGCEYMKVISLFEDRMLTDLEAEINFVDFHLRGIGPGRASIISVKISGCSLCKRIELSWMREKGLAKLNLLRLTFSVHSLSKISRYCYLIRIFHFLVWLYWLNLLTRLNAVRFDRICCF